MRRTAPSLIASGCLAAILVASSGCADTRPGETTRQAVTRLRVSGSGTCLPLLRILAAVQPQERVRLVFLPGLHSKGGIKGVDQGSLDIGAISRPLEPAEQSPSLKVTWLSLDGLVIAANRSVGDAGISGLTSQQVRDIYSGTYTDWKQLGASTSLPIVVLDRHEDESAKIIMRQRIFGPADTFKVTPKSVNLYYESDMVEAVRSTPGSIGYFSLGYAVSQKIDAARLTLDGVEASVASIQSGAYKLVRPLGIVTRTDAPPEVREFADWAGGSEAQAVMMKQGYAPYDE
jgi:phosphate transport system substrate-binding protein